MTYRKRGEILLVEDDSSLRRAVSLKLTREGYEVHTAETLKEAWEICMTYSLALIICDIGLPDGSGLDFCEKVRASGKIQGEGPTQNGNADCVFLFLTAMDTETDIINGYEAGGDDYIGADDAYAEEAGAVIRSGSISFDSSRNMVTRDGETLALTANEQKLLIYFLENPMKILSKNQLLEAIWDVDGDFVDDNTVAVNIRRLREKIEDDPSKPVLIKNVRGLGYIWERECERL